MQMGNNDCRCRMPGTQGKQERRCELSPRVPCRNELTIGKGGCPGGLCLPPTGSESGNTPWEGKGSPCFRDDVPSPSSVTRL